MSPPFGGASLLVTTHLLFQDLMWAPTLRPSASPANVPSLAFTAGTETGRGLCTRAAENVPPRALPSATQRVVKQTVKLRVELRA